MAIVIPKFRTPGATYFFIADSAGCIVGVCYPDGDRALRVTEAD